MASYQVSVTVVRAAIKQLQTEGLAEGQPGKGVYVIREPAPAQPSAEFVEITRRIEDLRDTLAAAMNQLDARLTALEQSLRHDRRRLDPLRRPAHRRTSSYLMVLAAAREFVTDDLAGFGAAVDDFRGS